MKPTSEWPFERCTAIWIVVAFLPAIAAAQSQEESISIPTQLVPVTAPPAPLVLEPGGRLVPVPATSSEAALKAGTPPPLVVGPGGRLVPMPVSSQAVAPAPPRDEATGLPVPAYKASDTPVRPLVAGPEGKLVPRSEKPAAGLVHPPLDILAR